MKLSTVFNHPNKKSENLFHWWERIIHLSPETTPSGEPNSEAWGVIGCESVNLLYRKPVCDRYSQTGLTFLAF
ncbi:hypothetical protein [Nostoc sp.]|uniref:hypothetical protein n=1 Tax=Nostoc sp. TaxID=1180 RepID=UPI002FFCC94C